MQRHGCDELILEASLVSKALQPLRDFFCCEQLYDGPPVDVWSLGVVLFAMVTGYLPFHAGQNKQELCQKIVRGQFATPDFISQEVADLLHRMLVVDPDKRITFPLIMQVGNVRN